MSKEDFLFELARPYYVDDFMTLRAKPFGKISIDIIKRYCLGAVFKYFDNPIYVDSPIIQDNLTGSTEAIKISDGASLRHTFHHFYFKILKDKVIDPVRFPLTYVEQGILFRAEEKERLTPFTRQTAFQVTDLHSFTLNKEQAMKDVASLLKCIRSFEKDWNVKFGVKCHVRDNSLIDWKEIETLWGESFVVNNDSEEEALIALDFDILLPNGKVIELSALEIFKVEIGDHESILVDFTLGGSERILAGILETNGVLPVWLAPIQVIAVAKNLNVNEIKQTEKLRVMIVENEEQLVSSQEKYQIPVIYSGDIAWETFRQEFGEKTPEILRVSPYKPVIIGKEGFCYNELF